MINDKKLFFFPLFTPRNICWGDSYKYPQHMSLGGLNTMFLNISNFLPHLELRNYSIQIVIIMNFVIVSNVGIRGLTVVYLVQWNCKLFSYIIYSWGSIFCYLSYICFAMFLYVYPSSQTFSLHRPRTPTYCLEV